MVYFYIFAKLLCCKMCMDILTCQLSCPVKYFFSSSMDSLSPCSMFLLSAVRTIL